MSIPQWPHGVPPDLSSWTCVLYHDTSDLAHPGCIRYRYVKDTYGCELRYQADGYRARQLVEVLAYTDGVLIEHWRRDPHDGTGAWVSLRREDR